MNGEEDMAILKIKGAWTGVLEVALDKWTILMLKEEVARLSEIDLKSIKLMSAGKVFHDDTTTLSQLGVKNNTKIFFTRISLHERDEFVAQDERVCRFNRLVAVVEDVVKKNHEDFDVELENQCGERVQFGTEADRQEMMMGLMLHGHAKKLIKRKMFEDALEVLTVAKSAFSLCDPKDIQLIDNVAILEIDMVWCYFMLQDRTKISMARLRLKRAREGLERAYGIDSSVLKYLQPASSLDLALYLRLELLEGVVAFHSDQFDECREALTSAQAKFSQLQVSDEAVSRVMRMGFQECDAKMALRLSNQEVVKALNLLADEQEKKVKQQEDNTRHKIQIMYEKKKLAEEALRRHENDTSTALGDLKNSDTIIKIECDVESRRRQRQVTDASIEGLVSKGFERSEEWERDVQIENELYAEIAQANVLSVHDDIEGIEECLEEYLSLLASLDSKGAKC